MRGRPEVEAWRELGTINVVSIEVEARIPDVPLVRKHGRVDIRPHACPWIHGHQVISIRCRVVEVARHLGVHILMQVRRHGECQTRERHDGPLRGATSRDLVHAEEHDIRLGFVVIVELHEDRDIEFHPEKLSHVRGGYGEHQEHRRCLPSSYAFHLES